MAVDLNSEIGFSAPTIARTAIGAYPIFVSVKSLKAPPVPHDIKPALAYIGDHWHDGDVTHVNFWAKPVVDYRHS